MNGNRLRTIRNLRGLTQQELAERAGVNQQAIARYEKNITEATDGALTSIARALNITSDYLLGLSDLPTPVSNVFNDISDRELSIIGHLRAGRTLEAIRTIVDRERAEND